MPVNDVDLVIEIIFAQYTLLLSAAPTVGRTQSVGTSTSRDLL